MYYLCFTINIFSFAKKFRLLSIGMCSMFAKSTTQILIRFVCFGFRHLEENFQSGFCLKFILSYCLIFDFVLWKCQSMLISLTDQSIPFTIFIGAIRIIVHQLEDIFEAKYLRQLLYQIDNEALEAIIANLFLRRLRIHTVWIIQYCGHYQRFILQ